MPLGGIADATRKHVDPLVLTPTLCFKDIIREEYQRTHQICWIHLRPSRKLQSTPKECSSLNGSLKFWETGVVLDVTISGAIGLCSGLDDAFSPRIHKGWRVRVTTQLNFKEWSICSVAILIGSADVEEVVGPLGITGFFGPLGVTESRTTSELWSRTTGYSARKIQAVARHIMFMCGVCLDRMLHEHGDAQWEY
ncbi:hypothetical protein AKJ16_DCAP20487 [Drosera capensis]